MKNCLTKYNTIHLILFNPFNLFYQKYFHSIQLSHTHHWWDCDPIKTNLQIHLIINAISQTAIKSWSEKAFNFFTLFAKQRQHHNQPTIPTIPRTKYQVCTLYNHKNNNNHAIRKLFHNSSVWKNDFPFKTKKNAVSICTGMYGKSRNKNWITLRNQTKSITRKYEYPWSF